MSDSERKTSGLSMYEPRNPAQSAFYKIVQENPEPWLAMVNEADDGWYGFARAYCWLCVKNCVRIETGAL